MSLFSFIKNVFGRSKPELEAPQAMRNKPGGLAWIRGIQELDGRIVTTVSLYAGEFWAIDPPQDYRCTRHHTGFGGVICKPGDNVRTIGIVDDCLEPIPDTGVTDEEVADLYAPKSKEAA